MKYAWSKNLHDSDGDVFEDCILVYIGDNTIIKFKDTNELESFAESILRSIKEINES